MAMAARPKLGRPAWVDGHKIEDCEHVAGLEKGLSRLYLGFLERSFVVPTEPIGHVLASDLARKP
jgi:hypothetical protein